MGAIVLLVFLIIAFIVMIAGIFALVKNRKKGNGNEAWEYPSFWMTLLGGIFFIAFLIWFIALGFKVIDAGQVGVQVRFGEVLENMLTEGFNPKSPFVKIYTYNIRLQEYTMSIATGESTRAGGSDAVDVRSLDNSLLSADGTVWWSVDPLKATDVYKKVSTSELGLQEMIIRPAIRTAMRDVAAKFNMVDLMQKREEYGTEVLTYMKTAVLGKGVIIDKILIRNIAPPKSIDDSISKKLSAEQELQQKEFELAKAKKDAEIRITEARGIAEAQNIIQQKLTPLYVQYEAIKSYEKLAGSPNTTFIIMPTNPNAAGMPLILGTSK
jgi:regulator of protease activity HflC (stomatin/prohibitin superfamily)